jgi:hypothetical protein
LKGQALSRRVTTVVAPTGLRIKVEKKEEIRFCKAGPGGAERAAEQAVAADRLASWLFQV